MTSKRRAILIVLDSAGIGAMPDAALYGDAGANTWGHIAEAVPALELPQLNCLGLWKLVPQFAGRACGQLRMPGGAGRMAERSAGKDTVTGHWELAGVVTEHPAPTFPDGFPDEFLEEIARRTGFTFLGNEVASGTEIIARLGDQHRRCKKPILYTSADSVLQIAAHEEVLPLAELYRLCEEVRALTKEGPYQVGRVIARPFTGPSGAYRRTADRRDFALEIPPRNLLCDMLRQGRSVHAVGKIGDIFSGVPFTSSVHTRCNEEGMDRTMDIYRRMEQGLLFVNLVDFDMKYGHRRDTAGYARALADFDAQLGELLRAIDEDTLVLITADHGCDPCYKGTDHTREYVPLFLAGRHVRRDTPLFLRECFADLAATLAEYFAVDYDGEGESFAGDVFSAK